jgi:hypothetical protein
MISMPQTTCGADGEIPGGIKLFNVTVVGSGVADTIDEGIDLLACSRWEAFGVTLDFNGSGDSGSIGMSNPARVFGSLIIDPGFNGINAGGAMDEAVFNGNEIRLAGVGINALGDDITATGNLIIDPTTFAINISGERPICTGNSSRETDSAFDRGFICGTTGANTGAGCTDDGADTEGVCDHNTLCNSGDNGC